MVRSRRRGFTLIELLTVMIIIGILAAILIPYFVRARYMAEWTACQSNIHNVAEALKLYANDNANIYPTSLDVLTVPTNGQRPFLAYIPVCPSNQMTYKGAYVTDNSSQPQYFTLYCPGVHYLILQNVRPGFPQWSATATGDQLIQQ